MKYVSMLTIILVVSLFMCGCSQGVGDVIASEEKTIEIAKEHAGIVHVERLEMSTAGPIFRVVFGTDKDGVKKAVWISKSVDFIEELTAGISRVDAISIAMNKGFTNLDEIELAYFPEGRDHPALNQSTGRVFWMIRSGDGFDNYELFIDFYTGSIAYQYGTLQDDYDYDKVVVLESVESGIAVCREVISRDEKNNKILGDTVHVDAAGENYAAYVVGREYRVIGNIISNNPLTVKVPQADMFIPLV